MINKDNVHLYIPYFQAISEGKTIQHETYPGMWFDLEEQDFLFTDDPEKYRVKPPHAWVRVALMKDGTVLEARTEERLNEIPSIVGFIKWISPVVEYEISIDDELSSCDCNKRGAICIHAKQDLAMEALEARIRTVL